jgi:hypothetical protein
MATNEFYCKQRQHCCADVVISEYHLSRCLSQISPAQSSGSGTQVPRFRSIAPCIIPVVPTELAPCDSAVTILSISVRSSHNPGVQVEHSGITNKLGHSSVRLLESHSVLSSHASCTTDRGLGFDEKSRTTTTYDLGRLPKQAGKSQVS